MNGVEIGFTQYFNLTINMTSDDHSGKCRVTPPTHSSQSFQAFKIMIIISLSLPDTPCPLTVSLKLHVHDQIYLPCLLATYRWSVRTNAVIGAQRETHTRINTHTLALWQKWEDKGFDKTAVELTPLNYMTHARTRARSLTHARTHTHTPIWVMGKTLKTIGLCSLCSPVSCPRLRCVVWRVNQASSSSKSFVNILLILHHLAQYQFWNTNSVNGVKYHAV
jgi:hypothetical protein